MAGLSKWKALAAATLALGVGVAVGVALPERAPEREADDGPRAGGQAFRDGGGGPQRGRGDMRPPAVTLAPVERAHAERSIAAVGTSRALQSLTVAADVAGIIEAIAVKPGAEVVKGAVLVQLEDDEQKIALARARADYAIARTNAERFSGLIEDEAASALENESAQNELTAATAALRQAEYNLSRRTITAPFAGIVGLTTLDVGDYLTPGATVTTVDDVSAVIVDFAVAEGAAAAIETGTQVAASSRAMPGRTFKGAVRAVDSRIDPATRTRRVEAVLDNAERALVPGAAFDVALSGADRAAWRVPGLAVQWDRAGSYVWRPGKDGAAERVSAIILQRTADSVVVDAALQDGDLVVAEGADLVRPGAPVGTGRRGASDAPTSAVR